VAALEAWEPETESEDIGLEESYAEDTPEVFAAEEGEAEGGMEEEVVPGDEEPMTSEE
jgi:hypothetical protein